MRVHLALFAGSGLILASACSASSVSDGGSGSSGGSTAGSTGGSTSGGTSGGTTGGADAGSPLPVGAACIANAQCGSHVCGATGTGHCCATACDTNDTTCGATDCDSTGSCIYPVSSCGTDSCTGNSLTHRICNGGGSCTPGAPTACPGNFNCKDATSCLTQCAVSATDCVTHFYCDTTSHRCLAQHPTGFCTTAEACTSGVCGVNGSGNCCTAQCAAATDPACNPTSCDANSGACVFPAGSACGASSCTGFTLTAGACDATGACNPSSAPCPNSLVCNVAGTTCLATCTGTSDCVTGFYCNATHCLPLQPAGGLCAADEACTTGLCGVKGTGHCCTGTCLTNDPTCGAGDCDNSGSCAYADNQSSCGASCTGGTQTNPTTCDGAGSCQPQGTTDCTPYVCGTNACLTSCTGKADCISGDFCDNDTGNGACCSGLTKGGTISVDSKSGSDATTCCGFGSSGACQTLTHAMALIDAAQAKDVTINATVNGGGGDWKAVETYPITLGWGVELNAPGVLFLDVNAAVNPEIFDIAKYSAHDKVGYASMVGSATSPISVGFNSKGVQTLSVSTIAIEAGNTLYIANASVNGSVTNLASFQALLVNGGAALVLGQDQSAGVTGTVFIGNSLGVQGSDSYGGIDCEADYNKQLGCTITDAPLVGQSSVIIQGQEDVALYVPDYGSVTLTANPVIGPSPSAPGFGNCASKVDAQVGDPAILIEGTGSVTMSNATVQCLVGTAFGLRDSLRGLGSPALTLDATTIQNTEIGINATMGTATVTNSTINYNYHGVVQAQDANGNNGTIDLSGGGNTVVCSSNQESSQGGTASGVDVYNLSTINLAADNVAWDTTGPDYFDCDSTLTICTCNISSCTTSAGSDDMDAVEDSTNKGGITTSNPMQASITCN